MEQHKTDNCKCHKQSQPAQQSLTELEFDRGIWNAAIYNEVDRVRSFITKGKSMDRDNCDYTALHYAARNGNEEICKILLTEGKVDVDAVTKGGSTALHRAAMMGNLNIVKLLINDGKAKLNLQDEDGYTILHRAAIRGHVNVCKYLVEIQPTLKDIKDKKDKIPYEYLLDTSNDELKNLLKL